MPKSATGTKFNQTSFELMTRHLPGVLYEYVMPKDGSPHYFRYVSENSFELLEVTPEEFQRDPTVFMKSIDPSMQEEYVQIVTECAENFTQFNMDILLSKRRSHTPMWIRARSSPVEEKNGDIVWYGFFYDISAEKRTQLENFQLREELIKEQAQRFANAKATALGQMAGGIAHEINNPLMIIMGRVHQMQRLLETSEMSKDELSRHLLNLETTVDRIQKIVSSMRQLNQPTNEGRPSTIQIQKVIKDILLLNETRFFQTDTHFEVTMPEKPLHIIANSIELGQVLVNLIGNAFDAVKSLQERWIRLEVVEKETKLEIRVTDSGFGIPNEIMVRLMTPFYTTKDKGMGLGLSISKAIVEKYDGRLYVDRNNLNTCFVVEFPLVKTKKYLDVQGTL